eukprot:CAMPEP_0198116534 /NCGR_PEP_ID=MMETSP1442-20131203/13160_1 /TAXON_ID= /ORGANISM="Craspedostauros australis, Strain CCMP3328" /LENGTH=226 /DNA_ID=CAMNT_0043774387 /DNA_START=12 /DNA_END=692 /DNA_ORIENTATION=-
MKPATALACLTAIVSCQVLAAFVIQHDRLPVTSKSAGRRTRSALGFWNTNKDTSDEDASSRDVSAEEGELDMSAFQKRKAEQLQSSSLGSSQRASEAEVATATASASANDDGDFDGYGLRDAILGKWGKCYDVDFNRVDSFGFRKMYLNVMPYHLEGRRFRHETELDYLCHLQAVVEILQKYDQLDYVLAQIQETDKTPRAGSIPVVAVPLRLDLTADQVTQIIGY